MGLDDWDGIKSCILQYPSGSKVVPFCGFIFRIL